MPIIAEIIEITKGKKVNNNFAQKQPSYVRYIQIEDLRNDDNLKYTDEKELIVVNENDIIVAWDGAYAGTIGYGLTGVIGSTLARLRINNAYRDKYNSRYLGFYLSTKFEYLQNTSTGATIPHINKSALTTLEVPFPDIETQNKIVTILDKAYNLIKKRKDTIEMFAELLRATFLEMFQKFQGTNTQKLHKIADVVSGLTKGKSYKEKVTHMFPYMRVANVQDGFLNLSEIKEIEATVEEAKRYKLEKDDLLLTEGGDPDKLGRGTLWKNQVDNCIYQNHIFRVRVKNREIVNPTFLSLQLSSQYGKAFFLKAAKQTSGIASINSTQLKSFPVYLPPIEIQVKFEEIVQKIEINKKALEQSAAIIKILVNSILQLAFKGELTFNTATDLEVFLNKIDPEKNDEGNDISVVLSNKALLQLLLKQLKMNEFKSLEQYEKGKYVIFRILKEKKDLIKQSYNSKKKQIELMS